MFLHGGSKKQESLSSSAACGGLCLAVRVNTTGEQLRGREALDSGSCAGWGLFPRGVVTVSPVHMEAGGIGAAAAAKEDDESRAAQPAPLGTDEATARALYVCAARMYTAAVASFLRLASSPGCRRRNDACSRDAPLTRPVPPAVGHRRRTSASAAATDGGAAVRSTATREATQGNSREILTKQFASAGVFTPNRAS